MVRVRPSVTGLVLVAVAAVLACAPSPSPSPAPHASSPDAPSPMAAAETIVVPTPVPAPSADAGQVDAEFTPPEPACPAPDGGVGPPRSVDVTNDKGEGLRTAMGSDEARGCGVIGIGDAAPPEYEAWFDVLGPDHLRFEVESGWGIVFYRPSVATGDGEVLHGGPGVVVSGAPEFVVVPTPTGSGDAVVALDMWVVRDDGKVVARIAPSVLVRVR